MRCGGSWRKKGVALLLLSLFLLSLTACGSGGDGAELSQEEPKELDLASLSQRLLTEVAYEEELVALAPDVFYSLFGIDEADVAEQYNYFSGGATAEELVVMKAAEGEALDRLTEAVNNRLIYQKELYATYDPGEVERLEEAVVLTAGDFVFYCVSSDSKQAARILEEALA